MGDVSHPAFKPLDRAAIVGGRPEMSHGRREPGSFWSRLMISASQLRGADTRLTGRDGAPSDGGDGFAPAFEVHDRLAIERSSLVGRLLEQIEAQDHRLAALH